MSLLQIFLFGIPRFVRDGLPLSISRRKSIALLSYLAVTNQTYSRDSLAALFWPEHDQSRARTNLRRELYRAKDAVGEEALLIDRDQVSIAPECRSLDVEEFGERVSLGQKHNHFPDQNCRECQAGLTEAVALYADDFMAGFSLPDNPTFEEWQFFQRENLRQSLAGALQQLLQWHSLQKDFEPAIEYGRRWLALDPLHEPAHRQLMLLYAWSGQQSAALRQYQECARLLEQELSIQPEAETRELYESIRTKQVSALTPPPRPTAEPASETALSSLPTGTVTFLFTEIEGGPPLWEQDAAAMQSALGRRNRILHDAIASHGGQAYKFIGASIQAAFQEPASALAAALAGQRALTAETWEETAPVKVRMAIHAGTAEVHGGDYSATQTLNRTARLLSAAHGGQVLLSTAVVELVRNQMPEDVRFKDLGRHRLKGLSRPDQIFQAIAPGLPEEFPPIKTRTIEVHNLPNEPTTFIGREQELARLEEILLNAEARLVTVVGLGGTGKTQLALAFARRMIERQPDLFEKGIFFVPLAGVETAEAFPAALAKALKISLAGQIDSIAEVSNYLRDQKALLILDNFEQLIDGVTLVDQLLRASTGLKLLVTSREPLRLTSEWRLDLDGLPYPKDTLYLNESLPINGKGLSIGKPASSGNGRYESMDLFVQTAWQSGADFELTPETAPAVGRLCQLVAGFPLAIKLAATWLRVMSVEQIVAEVSRNMDILTSRMRDIPARQRSMRAVFEQTWELLRADEQAAFRALSVFRGGFTEEAAVQVAGISPFLLLGLLDRGLAQRVDENRYEVHELTRQFAAEKLKATDVEQQEQVAQKHSAYYLNLVAHYDQPLHGENPGAPLTVLKVEIDNVRQAWHWAVTHRQVNLITHTIDAVAAFYEYAGLIAEGERMFGEAAQAVETEASSRETRELLCNLLVKHLFFAHIRGVSKEIEAKTKKIFALSRELDNQERLADAFLIHGFTLEFTGEYEAALGEYKQARDLYHELRLERELAAALNQMGETLVFLSDPGKAEVYHLQALKIGYSRKDLRLRALSLSYLGVVYYYLNDFPQAVSYWEQAIALFERLQDARGLGRTTNNIAHVHNLLGNYQAGLESITRALGFLRQIGDLRAEAAAYDTMGSSYFGLGNYAEARQCYQQTFQCAQETGTMQQYEASFLTSLAVLNSAEGQYEEAEAQLRSALETIKELEPPREIAHALASLGNLYSQTGRHTEALGYYDEALETLKQVGEKSETAPILIQKARALFELGDLEQAQRLNHLGLEIAHDSGRKPAIFQGRLLSAKLAHALGRGDEASEILRKLLHEFPSETERAEIYFTIWRMSGEREPGEKALALYQRLSVQTPNIVYRERVKELEPLAIG